MSISISKVANALGENITSSVSIGSLLSKLPHRGKISFANIHNAIQGSQLTSSVWYIPSRGRVIKSISNLGIIDVAFMTITFWIYIGTITEDWRSILNFTEINKTNRRPALFIKNQGNGFHIRNDTFAQLNEGVFDTSSISSNLLNMKFCIAITWNNRTMTIYKNGMLLQNFIFAGDLLQPNNNYDILSGEEYQNPTTGGVKLANVKYYPATLGASKIHELYMKEKSEVSDDSTFPPITLVNEDQSRATLYAGTLVGGTTQNTTQYSQYNWVRLTSRTGSVFGILYYYEILGSSWTCKFDFWNDYPGDSIWFAAYMTKQPIMSTYMFEHGVALNGGGYRFVADDYEQTYQIHGPQANGVSGPVDNDGNYITHVASGNISNSTWRTMKIEFQRLNPSTNNMKMYVNNVLIIDINHTPPSGHNVDHSKACYFGFGSRTGGAFGEHYVKNMIITRSIQTSSIGISFYHPDGRSVKLNGLNLRLNSGNEITFDIYAGSDVFNWASGRIAFFGNGQRTLSMRHTGLVIYLYSFTANNYDWAWLIQRVGLGHDVNLYNDYGGGYYLGYDSPSDRLLIVSSSDTRRVTWRMSPLSDPSYTF